MTDNKSVALIVEDEFLIAEGFRFQLDLMGIEVCGVVSTADEAVDLAVEHNPGFVLMDVRLEGERDGVDAAMAIYEKVGSKVIFVTGSREPETISRIAQDHPFATLFKPISAIQLKRTVERAVQ